MQDGVDRRALSAELQTLAPDDRRRPRREFSQWLREASRAAGLLSNLGVFVVGIAVAICGFSFELHPPVLAWLPLALVILILGAWLNIHSARRARQWRQTHPFEKWRAAQGAGTR